MDNARKLRTISQLIAKDMHDMSGVPHPCQYTDLCKSDPTNILDEHYDWIRNQDMKIPIWSRLYASNCVGHSRQSSFTHERNYNVEIPQRLYSLWGNTDTHSLVAEKMYRLERYQWVCNVLICCSALMYNLNDWSATLLDDVIYRGSFIYAELCQKNHLINRDFNMSHMNTLMNFRDTSFRVNIEEKYRGFLFIAYGYNELNLARALVTFFRNYQFGIIECRQRCLAFGFATDVDHGYFMYDCQCKGEPFLPDKLSDAYVLRTNHLQILLYCMIVAIDVSCANIRFKMYNVDVRIEDPRERRLRKHNDIMPRKNVVQPQQQQQQQQQQKQDKLLNCNKVNIGEGPHTIEAEVVLMSQVIDNKIFKGKKQQMGIITEEIVVKEEEDDEDLMGDEMKNEETKDNVKENKSECDLKKEKQKESEKEKLKETEEISLKKNVNKVKENKKQEDDKAKAKNDKEKVKENGKQKEKEKGKKTVNDMEKQEVKEDNTKRLTQEYINIFRPIKKPLDPDAVIMPDVSEDVEVLEGVVAYDVSETLEEKLKLYKKITDEFELLAKQQELLIKSLNDLDKDTVNLIKNPLKDTDIINKLQDLKQGDTKEAAKVPNILLRYEQKPIGKIPETAKILNMTESRLFIDVVKNSNNNNNNEKPNNTIGIQKKSTNDTKTTNTKQQLNRLQMEINKIEGDHPQHLDTEGMESDDTLKPTPSNNHVAEIKDEKNKKSEANAPSTNTPPNKSSENKSRKRLKEPVKPLKSTKEMVTEKVPPKKVSTLGTKTQNSFHKTETSKGKSTRSRNRISTSKMSNLPPTQSQIRDHHDSRSRTDVNMVELYDVTRPNAMGIEVYLVNNRSHVGNAFYDSTVPTSFRVVKTMF